MSLTQKQISEVTLAHIRTLANDLKQGMHSGLYKECSIASLEQLHILRVGLDFYADKLEQSFKDSGFSINENSISRS